MLTSTLSNLSLGRLSRWASLVAGAATLAATVIGACSAPAPMAGPLSDVVIDVPPGTCVGPKVPGAAAAPVAVDPSVDWALEDTQPRSCGFGQRYGLEAFRGRPIIVALLAAW